MGHRHPIFARVYTVLSRGAERAGMAEHRTELLAGLAGRVIEVGAGNGLNFAHYPAAVTEVVAVEPEPYLRARAIEAAARAPVPVRVLDGIAEQLPVTDASLDAGVTSLVLCSVSDQRAALAELFRVIEPGGELRFYEHVVAESERLSRVQRAIDAVWPMLSGGCHTARDTPRRIAEAGFEITEIRRFDFGPPSPVRPHVIGRAGRPKMGLEGGDSAR